MKSKILNFVVTLHSKKYLSTIFISLLIAGISLSQQQSGDEKNSLSKSDQAMKEIEKAKQKKIKTRYRYVGFYDASGKKPNDLKLIEKISFDENGFRKEQIRYTNRGSIDIKYIFSFDKKGNLLKMNTLNAAGKRVGGRESVYDKKGREVESRKYDPKYAKPFLTRQKYDSKGNMIESKFYNEKGKLAGIVSNTYQGNLLAKTIAKDPKGKKMGETNFEYDAKGNLIKETTVELQSSYTVKYKYDSAGNMIEIDHPTFKRFMNYNQNNDLVEDKMYEPDGKRQFRVRFNYDQNGLQKEEIRYTNEEKPAFYAKFEFEFYK